MNYKSKIKRGIASLLIGILCILNLLQPIAANAEENVQEKAVAIATDMEVDQNSNFDVLTDKEKITFDSTTETVTFKSSNPTFDIQVPGTYTVTYMVTNNSDASDTYEISRLITVKEKVELVDANLVTENATVDENAAPDENVQNSVTDSELINAEKFNEAVLPDEDTTNETVIEEANEQLDLDETTADLQPADGDEKLIKVEEITEDKEALAEIPILDVSAFGMMARAAEVGIEYYGKVQYGNTTVGNFTVNGQLAFCMEHLAPTPMTGAEFSASVYSDENIKKVLYYGWGGAEQWVGFGSAEQGMVLTSLALSYYYSGPGTIGMMPHGSAAQSNGLSDFFYFIESHSVPITDMSFSKTYSEAGASNDGTYQKTDTFTLNSDIKNTITINCPTDVTLRNLTTGAVGTGAVTVKGGDSFLFTAPFSVTGTWASGNLSSSMGKYQSIVAITDGGVQDIGYGLWASDPDKIVSLQIKWLDKGSIVVNKKDADTDTTLQGTTFEVKAKDDIVDTNGSVLVAAGTVVGTMVTGADGNAVFENLFWGTYEVTEIGSTPGYLLTSITKEVVLNTPMSSVDYSNSKNRLEISKTDAETKEALEGVKYNLWSDTKEEKIEYVTDEEGKIAVTGLIPDTYYLQEAETLDGYVLDSMIHKFVVTPDGLIDGKETYTFELENDFTKVQISKVDITSEKELEGATLQILDKDKNMIKEWVSTNEPHLIERLPVGEYILHEQIAPYGYLYAQDISFTVKETGEIQKIVMKDKLHEGFIRTSTPNNFKNGFNTRGTVKTGDSTFFALYVLILGIALAYLVLFAIKKKKKELNKKIMFFLIISILFSGNVSNVMAKDKISNADFKKEITYTTENEKETKEDQFQQQISKNEKKYKLESIDYEVLNKTPIMQEKKVSKTITSEALPAEALFEPEQIITEGTSTMKLVNVEKEDAVVTEAYQQMVNAYTDYDYAVSNGNVPGTKQISVTNDLTGKQETITCNLTNVIQTDGDWEDTYIDVTFVSYDATIFNWNGIIVSRNEANPLAGYENQLLASVGADASNYRVLSTNWTNGAYTDNEGVLCRDARASVLKHVRYYRANYSGSIQQEAVKGFIYKANYNGTVKMESKTDFKYDMKATANYQEVNSNAAFIVLGAAIVIFAGLMIGILMLVAKKRKEEKKHADIEKLHY